MVRVFGSGSVSGEVKEPESRLISTKKNLVYIVNMTEAPGAYTNGRVTLQLADLPVEMRSTLKVRRDGRYCNVYERKVKRKRSNDDEHEAAAFWYQPMFKKTIDGKITWFTRLGSYSDAGVAAVAAQMGLQRYKEGRIDDIAKVEEDLVHAAAQYRKALALIARLLP